MGKEANVLTVQIVNYVNNLRGGYIFKVNNAPTRRHKGTVTKGVPDIMGVTHMGVPLAIEVKIGKDRQSEFQEAFAQEWSKRGGEYIVARDLLGFIESYNTIELT